jgi:exonuclease SbcD
MRFLHTADWHLGRIFHGAHLTEDQAFVLDGLHDLLKETQCDALVIAGDVFDRAVPPIEAITLFDEFLNRVLLDLKIPVILIAGNHDSPERLGFASRLLRQHKLFVSGSLRQSTPVILSDNHGEVTFTCIPYAEPAFVRSHFQAEAVNDHHTAMDACLSSDVILVPNAGRRVLVAHAFVVGSEECESERPLTVGGTGMVHSSIFDQFHYVALGHLHRPQVSGAGRIHYSGSLLQYSFSEISHTKSVNIVDMDAGGEVKVERVSLTPRRRLRRIEGTLASLLQEADNDSARSDYIVASVTDDGALLDVMGRLRTAYPNIMHVERPALLARLADLSKQDRRNQHKRSEFELFQNFFQQIGGRSLTDSEASEFQKVLEHMWKVDREVQL